MASKQFFEFGLWNAWIGMIFLHGISTAFMITNKKLGRRLSDMSWYRPKERIAAYTSLVFAIFLIFFSVGVPLQSGTPWFYTGFFIYTVSLIGYSTAFYNYATTPPDKTVCKGVYNLSRNPMYFFYATAVLGLVVASASLYFLVVWIIYNICTHYVILAEERYCLKTYGESYKKFMNKTNRYI